MVGLIPAVGPLRAAAFSEATNAKDSWLAALRQSRVEDVFVDYTGKKRQGGRSPGTFKTPDERYRESSKRSGWTCGFQGLVNCMHRVQTLKVNAPQELP
jgi:hypothetical protein